MMLMRLIVEASLHPSIIDEESLSNSYKFLSPSVEIWSGEKYKRMFDQIFRSMRDEVKLIMKQLSSKISVTLDFWTNYEQISFMSVTCHWIDENWCLKKVLLDICCIPSRDGSDEICDSLIKILKFYNLDERVLACTHNNPNINNKKLGLLFHYVPCCAHALGSMMDEGLCSSYLIISKIRDVVLKISSSQEIFDDFAQCASTYEEGNWSRPLDISARWSGNYHMLDLARKANKSIDAIIKKHDKALGSARLLSAAEKDVVKTLHDYLEPFHKIITCICTIKVLTTGLVLLFMNHIRGMIERCDPDWLKATAEKMALKADNYLDQAFNSFTYMQSILDPRIQKRLMPERLDTVEYLEEAKEYLMKNYSSNHILPMSSSTDFMHQVVQKIVLRKKRRVIMPDELTDYLEQGLAPISENVLEWWRDNRTCYPKLSSMARDFLAVQPTAVAPEEIFCKKGDETERRRFSMPFESTALLCIGSWMQFGVKLNCGSDGIE